MKAYTINNCTKHNIIVDWQDRQQIVLANSMQTIEAEANDTLRIFKAENNSVCLCIAKYFDNDSVRNILIKLILLINFDLYIDIKNAPKRITINERYYHFYTIFMFSLLQVNGNNRVSYEYHQSADKKKLLLFSSASLFSMAAVCLVMTVVSLVALFEEFSGFALLITLITVGLYYVFISLVKTIKKFKNFSENLSYILEESKTVCIGHDNGWFIKYWENLD
ncbi:MAG: hypothetical protein J6A67_04895 [Clostridia bacterium]|nr:hypothetical protein [Clostridia bacterium]